MLRVLVAMVLLLAGCVPAYATWSVVAVDDARGTVVVASATCVTQQTFAQWGASGLMDIQTVVVPGKGAAVVQSNVDRTRASQKALYAGLQQGTDPERMLAGLRQDPDFETRQYAILDTTGRHAASSGTLNRPAALHSQGRVNGTSIWYSVQGNVLVSDEVVRAAVAAFVEANGTLADRVMAALEGGDSRGGDKRCSCDVEPRVNAPCETKASHVAYLLQAEPGDQPGSSYNDGRYAMYLSATHEDIKPEENANPVRTLRLRYEAWKRSQRR